MRFICDTAPGRDAVITHAYNPVTGALMSITPPFTWGAREQFDIFATNVDLFCREMAQAGPRGFTVVDLGVPITV